MLRWIFDWYTGDGWGIFVGKLIVTLLFFIATVDSVLETHYLGLFVVTIIVVIPTLIFKFGPAVVKILHVIGVVNLTGNEEIVRKGFGLVTSVEAWCEMLFEWIFR